MVVTKAMTKINWFDKYAFSENLKFGSLRNPTSLDFHKPVKSVLMIRVRVGIVLTQPLTLGLNWG